MRCCAHILNVIVKHGLDEMKFDFGCKFVIAMSHES
jgi:hypothetical protein